MRQTLSARQGLSTFDRNLPDILDYKGEFGAELVLFLPFVTWLSEAGLLHTRTVGTYRGMRCFYDSLDCRDIVEKDEPRTYVRPRKRLACLPVRNEHTFDGVGRSPRHTFPDLRQRFRAVPIPVEIERRIAARPLLVIHNKHNTEWGRQPVNHIPLNVLDVLLEALEPDFTIVYVRHGMNAAVDGFSQDHNSPRFFGDRAVVERHRDVVCFDDLYADHIAAGGSPDINAFKNALYSRCHRFISSQGGGAHHIAYFSGSLMIVLHRAGREARLAYGDGYYGFLSTPAPVRAICSAPQDLLAALPLLQHMEIREGRAHIATEDETLLERLSPWTVQRRTPLWAKLRVL